MAFKERLGRFLDALESRWSLFVHGVGVVTSFSIPAWAVRTTDIFNQYSPASWVAAGVLGIILFVLIRLVWHWTTRLKVNAKYDARFIERSGSAFNPLDLTFERRRIYLEDFALPSHPIIDGKTFIDCDIIGPANMYWQYGNSAVPIRPPRMDAVCLEAKNLFSNGIIIRNCIFRNCSFQRVTMFALPEIFPEWRDNPNLNWISIPPTPEQISERMKLLSPPSSDQAASEEAEQSEES